MSRFSAVSATRDTRSKNQWGNSADTDTEGSWSALPMSETAWCPSCLHRCRPRSDWLRRQSSCSVESLGDAVLLHVYRQQQSAAIATPYFVWDNGLEITVRNHGHVRYKLYPTTGDLYWISRGDPLANKADWPITVNGALKGEIRVNFCFLVCANSNIHVPQHSYVVCTFIF